ncbi:hypothetical protein C3L33_04764, partial [Rhododendron williamsianum]
MFIDDGEDKPHHSSAFDDSTLGFSESPHHHPQKTDGRTRRGVQERQIDVQYTSDCIILPPTLFTCTTLVVFKLRSLVQMEIPGLVRFPNLRVLHVSLQFPFGDMIQKLFCSCPVLEDFSIRGYIDNSQAMAFDISTVALKKLEIDFKDQGFEYSDNEFVINAPILEHLTLRDNYFALYRLKNLSSLFRADIDVGDGVGCIEIYGWKERANQVYELLKGISNVKYLTLGARTMGALDYADDNNLPLLFPNITHLKLRVSNSSSWKRLTYLLSCMPNLENLEVSTKKEFELHDHLNLAAEPNWIEPVPEQTPTCLLLHLKEIGLTGFTSKIYHLNLIKYLLENAKVLIKMAINTRNLAVEEEVEFLRHLVTCRRGALACTIELSRK